MPWAMNSHSWLFLGVRVLWEGLVSARNLVDARAIDQYVTNCYLAQRNPSNAPEKLGATFKEIAKTPAILPGAPEPASA